MSIDWPRALLLALSAWCSFVVAVILQVENPYWAAMPVWVIANSTRGVLLERAIYRVMGTVVGAAVGLLILLTEHALLQLLLMTLMIFISAGSLQLVQGVRSYMVLLSGVTVSVVVLPALLSPENSIELAWARIEATLIGVVIGTLLTGFATPKNPRAVFYQQVRNLAADAVQMAVLVLTRPPSPKIDQQLKQLSVRISGLEAKAEYTAAGSVDGHRRNAYVEALLFAALEIIASALQLQQQIQRGMQISQSTIEQLELFSLQFRQGERIDPLRRQDPDDVPDKVSLARLRRALGQLKRAEAALFAGSDPFWRRGIKVRRFEPSRDWITARRNAYVCGLLSISAASMTYLTQNNAIALAATGVCLFSLIVSTNPQPHIQVRHLVVGAGMGALIAGLYRLGVQPYLKEPLWMMLSLLPFMLLGAITRVHPKTQVPALDATMSFLLVSQFGMPAVTFVEVVQGSGALIVGTCVIAMSFILLPRHKEAWANVLLGLVIKELHSVIVQRPPQAVSQWRTQMARHILTMLQWMGAQTPAGLLGLMNFGYSVIAWQRITAHGTAHVEVGVRVQQELMHFELHPESCILFLNQMAEKITNKRLANTLYDMADALDRAKPILWYRLKRSS